VENQSVHVNAKSITVTFGGVDVVKDVDLDLHAGEIHALVGENGAGKSSLAKVIAGVYRARLGSVLLDGAEIKLKSPREALKHGIALIHQEPLTFPDLDVTENTFVGHLPGSCGVVDWGQAHVQARAILDSLGANLSPHERVGGLSVAQQQRVEVAAATSHAARVWIFDETTAPLTPKEVEDLFVIMRRLRGQGCALLMVTHHLDEVFAIADRITVLRDGRKVAEKTPAGTSIPEIVRLMVGRELSGEKLHSTTAATAAPILQVKNLSGAGFRNATLQVRPSEVVTLAGLVGAGRTELARALFGITRPTGGVILWDGHAVVIPSPQSAMKLGIALVPEDRQHDGLLMPQAISFNATLAFLKRLSPGAWLLRGKLNEVSRGYANRLNLVHLSQDQPVNQLSGGNQQKVVLAKWLMTGPKLLILDEPTRGVDVGAKHEVHKLIREQADQGLAVLMISSDLPEVLALSDRIVVMHQGRTIAEFEGSTATEQQIMFAATGHEAAIGA
jgi:rhamnose transport system ATP-binding protein